MGNSEQVLVHFFDVIPYEWLAHTTTWNIEVEVVDIGGGLTAVILIVS